MFLGEDFAPFYAHLSISYNHNIVGPPVLVLSCSQIDLKENHVLNLVILWRGDSEWPHTIAAEQLAKSPCVLLRPKVKLGGNRLPTCTRYLLPPGNIGTAGKTGA